jgi:hypothetical protein
VSTEAANAAIAGNRVILDIPPKEYPLPNGLRPGDLVELLNFQPGYWRVRRESDGVEGLVFMLAIDRIVS